MLTDTGNVFLYSDYLPHLLSGVISKVSGKSLEDYAKLNLFDPLEISDFKWEKSHDGLNFGSFSLYLKPRDLAKIGQLCLQEGIWNNQQIIEKSWIEEATQKQSTGQNYGYLFWIDPDHKAFQMTGNGGQFVFICPSKNL